MYSLKKIFISSVTYGNEDLRERLHQLGNLKIPHVWVAEKDNRKLAKIPPFNDPLVIVDSLLDELAQSDLMIVVLGNSNRKDPGRDHGSLIPISGKISNVSYFEIELYQAALMGKPLRLFVTPGFDPSPRMRAFLRLLRPYFPEESWQVSPDDKIIEDVESLIEGRVSVIRSPLIGLSTFVEKLWQSGRDDMLFLDGKFDESRSGKTPDLDVIENALSQNVFNLSGNPVTHDKRLARAWIALRELMGVSYLDSNNKEYLDLWNRALTRWSEPAAWYGLHGHMLMGCLTAINSTAIVREQLRSHPNRKNLSFAQLQDPGGAKASALYSIGKLLPYWWQRRKVFNTALNTINTALASEQSDVSGLKSIRASINLRLYRFGRAVEDYEAALKLRRSHDESDGRIGESMVELGFAYMLSLSFFKGRSYMEEGIKLLSNAGRDEFLMRAKRKLAFAYRVTLRKSDALREEKEARELADKRRAFDQKRQIR
jgi:tetratricopeptide (TPR) repeat protein